MGFTSPLVVEQIDEKFWNVKEPLGYEGDTQSFEVPVGFRTDFASVPRPVSWLIPRYGVYTRSAILHDYLIRNEIVDIADADGIFRRTMRELNVSLPRRWMMWAAVRIGSGLKGITLPALLVWIAIAVPSVIFLVIPTVVVTVFLILFWFIELAAFAISRVMPGKGEARAPRPEMHSS